MAAITFERRETPRAAIARPSPRRIGVWYLASNSGAPSGGRTPSRVRGLIRRGPTRKGRLKWHGLPSPSRETRTIRATVIQTVRGEGTEIASESLPERGVGGG